MRNENATDRYSGKGAQNIYEGKYPCLVTRNLTHLRLTPQTLASLWTGVYSNEAGLFETEARDVTNCIYCISLDQSVAMYLDVCSTGKRSSSHYYIRHFLSWRRQWYFFSPLGKKISHAKIFQALPTGLLPEGPTHCHDFPLKITSGEGIDSLTKSTDKEPHPQNIFTMCSVVQKQLVWQNYVKTHRTLSFNSSWQTTPYKTGVLPK